MPAWAPRLAFGAYVLVLLTATHWPTVDLGPAPPNTDKVLHIGAYAVWGALALASGLFGRWSAPSTLVRVGLAGTVFAAIDEATQSLPGVNRHASLSDWIADILGLALALAAAWVVSHWLARRRGAGS
ncbi:MAG: VanZ family protein [Phycisphaerales bacterium]